METPGTLMDAVRSVCWSEVSAGMALCRWLWGKSASLRCTIPVSPTGALLIASSSSFSVAMGSWMPEKNVMTGCATPTSPMHYVGQTALDLDVETGYWILRSGVMTGTDWMETGVIDSACGKDWWHRA